MIELTEALESAAQEVAREPQSPRASDTIAWMIEKLDDFLASPQMKQIAQLAPQDRAALAEVVAMAFQRVLDNLRDMLGVAVQTELIGGQVPWGAPLSQGIGRLKTTLGELGFSAEASTRPLPTVVRVPSASGGAPTFIVANVSRPSPLGRYVALALRDARPRELEPGCWYADLDAFPGVWADGPSPKECLDALAEVLEDWLLVKLAHRDRDIPAVGQIDLTTLMHE